MGGDEISRRAQNEVSGHPQDDFFCRSRTFAAKGQSAVPSCCPTATLGLGESTFFEGVLRLFPIRLDASRVANGTKGMIAHSCDRSLIHDIALSTIL